MDVALAKLPLTLLQRAWFAALDPKEKQARIKELQKLRALESYYTSKCKRIKKIKSKSYHRIKKKQREGEAKKELEAQLLNPETAKDALEKAENSRALERANLRHKNTSKWVRAGGHHLAVAGLRNLPWGTL